MVIIVMGVSGVGKTTVGLRLAGALGDEDRWPWLERLRGLIGGALESGEDLVLACSALKRAYRERLTVEPVRQRWVYLDAPRELIARRLAERRGHYMPATLLDSQLAALEVPEAALRVDVSAGPDAVVSAILQGLGLPEAAGGA